MTTIEHSHPLAVCWASIGDTLEMCGFANLGVRTRARLRFASGTRLVVDAPADALDRLRLLTPDHPTLTELAMPTQRHSAHVVDLCFEGDDGTTVDLPLSSLEVEFDAVTGRRGTTTVRNEWIPSTQHATR
jgi:hypothetical protein